MLLRPLNEYTTWSLACISSWGDGCDPSSLLFRDSHDYFEEIKARKIDVEQFVEMRTLAKRAVSWLSSVDSNNFDSSMIPNTVNFVCMDGNDIWMGAQSALRKEEITENEAEEIRRIILKYHDKPRFLNSGSPCDEPVISTTSGPKQWWKFWGQKGR